MKTKEFLALDEKLAYEYFADGECYAYLPPDVEGGETWFQNVRHWESGEPFRSTLAKMHADTDEYMRSMGDEKCAQCGEWETADQIVRVVREHSSREEVKHLRTYFGSPDEPFFLVIESHGPIGLVQAQTWEEAYEIAEDVIFDDAPFAELEECSKDYGHDIEQYGAPEGYGFRPNGIPTDNVLTSECYQVDLNWSEVRQVLPGEPYELAGVTYTLEVLNRVKECSECGHEGAGFPQI